MVGPDLGLCSASMGCQGAAICAGDCDGDSMVAIDELLLGVAIALDGRPIDACPVFANDQGRIDIAQLVKGVRNALNGCGNG